MKTLSYKRFLFHFSVRHQSGNKFLQKTCYKQPIDHCNFINSYLRRVSFLILLMFFCLKSPTQNVKDTVSR